MGFRSRLIGVCLAAVVLALGVGALSGAGQAPPPGEGAAQPELVAPGVVSTGDDEAHATLSPDGRLLYFLKDAPDFSHWNIVVSTRAGDSWAAPEVAPFSGRYSDADLSFAPGGDLAYFVSNRPVDGGESPRADTEIWRLRRKGETWGDPEHVVELTSEGTEWYPNATADGWLYFGSERRAGNRGPAGTSDLWRARLRRGSFAPPENLGPAVNTPGEDIEPWLSDDGRLMIFASNGRPDTLGAYGLYVSRLCGDSWGAPRHLGGGVNSSRWDFGARPTPDGRWLLFTSNRVIGGTPRSPLDYQELLRKLHSPGNGLRDVYRVAMASLDLGPECGRP